jgi:AbiV family abortive infection protein
MAKVPMLIGAAVDVLSGRVCNWLELHRRLHSHTEKIMGIIVVDYFTDKNIEKDPNVERLREDLERTKDYKELKESSLYTGLFDDSFQKPSELINPDLSTSLVKLARDRLNFFQALNLPEEGKLEETIKSPFFEDLSERFIDPLRKKIKPRRK